MVGWVISLIGFIIFFNVVGKQQRKGKNVSTIRKILACILCFHINGIGIHLLYEPVMEVFDINTDGFMNMNGLVTAAVMWIVIAITVLIVSSYVKELLGSLYSTIRTTQKVFLFLPIILLIVFFFVVSFK
ncbi:hypothetical protein SAMN02927937_02377 [Paenimyroides aquimaris]|uniref:Uncharacterized protein n=1 Tax=Paenimyroides marinum TaxID=1159016 RepID=A0A1H6MDA1_9FLAO|nr:hypothetical protein SAMN02927937_02377 [Paenimyroides aquimaris]